MGCLSDITVPILGKVVKMHEAAGLEVWAEKIAMTTISRFGNLTAFIKGSQKYLSKETWHALEFLQTSKFGC